MDQEVDQVAELGSSLVPYALQAAFNTIFVVGTMFVLDFRLTCMVLPPMPVFFVFRRYFEARLRAASDDAQHESSLESSFLQEHLTSIIQIQLLCQARNQTRPFIDRPAPQLSAINHLSLIDVLFLTSLLAP